MDLKTIAAEMNVTMFIANQGAGLSAWALAHNNRYR
jgi:hypothetical protein